MSIFSKFSYYLPQNFRLSYVSKVFFSLVYRNCSRTYFLHQQGKSVKSEAKSHIFIKRTKMNGSKENKDSGASNILFQGKTDRYQGVTIFSDDEPCQIETFSQKLRDSLEAWKLSKKRGIWFKVRLEQSEWVPILVKNGFRYHHAKDDYVMLYLWLPDEICNIPAYAHTMIGVGALVLNENDEVLVVQEKYHLTPTRMWKLPGGYAEPGENLVDAAIREVIEETNIRAEFDSLLTLRHGHGGPFKCSDIYVVVSLKAKSVDILKCDREIADCQWMNIEEYLNHSQIHELNRFFVHKYLEYRKHNHKIECRHGIHQVLKKPYTVYSIIKDEEEDQAGENLKFQWQESSSKNNKL